MTLDVTKDLVINRPRDEVAAYVIDPAHDPIWIGGIREAEMLTPPPVAEGTQVRRVARFLGRRIEYVLEIARLEPDTEVVMRSVKSPFPMNVTYGFADAPGGTEVTIRVTGAGGRLAAVGVRRGIAGDLKRLKGLLESRGSADTGKETE